jgi:hypothetical protein
VREKVKNKKVGVAFSTNRARAAISFGAEKKAKTKDWDLELEQTGDQKAHW